MARNADHLLNVFKCVLILLLTAAAPSLSSDGAFPAAVFKSADVRSPEFDPS